MSADRNVTFHHQNDYFYHKNDVTHKKSDRNLLKNFCIASSSSLKDILKDRVQRTLWAVGFVQIQLLSEVLKLWII